MASEQPDIIYFEKNEIDQLHNAVLAISKQCFDLKKACITIIVAIFAIIPNIKPTSNSIDYTSLYYCISVSATLFFYLADSYCYYYQRKLRARIDQLVKIAKHKSSIEYYYGPNSCSKTTKATIFNAMFNPSQCFYLILIILLLGVSFFYRYLVQK